MNNTLYNVRTKVLNIERLFNATNIEVFLLCNSQAKYWIILFKFIQYMQS